MPETDFPENRVIRHPAKLLACPQAGCQLSLT